MRSGIAALMLLIASGPALAAETAAQMVGNLEVRVTGARTATEWEMMPGFPGGPKFKPQEPGKTLLVIKFSAKDPKTGKTDTDASFKNFSAATASGETVSGGVEQTDLREVPFAVNDPSAVTKVSIGGATFDVYALTKGLKKP